MKKKQKKMCLIKSVIKIHICFFLPRLVFKISNASYYSLSLFVDGVEQFFFGEFLYAIIRRLSTLSRFSLVLQGVSQFKEILSSTSIVAINILLVFFFRFVWCVCLVTTKKRAKLRLKILTSTSHFFSIQFQFGLK